MHRLIPALAATSLLIAALASAEEIPQKTDPAYTWDLTELYATAEDWNAAREQVLEDLQKIHARRGTLGESADSLYRTMDLVSETTRDALRVYAYASLASDEDLRVNETQERKQLGDIMYARFTEATAWIQPELLDVGREVIDSYINEDERLERFAFQLDNGLRNAPHTLGDEAEETLAYFTQTFGAANNIYSVVANSDIPWPSVTLSNGEEQTIDSQGYSRWRASENRDDRKKVFDAFWGEMAGIPQQRGLDTELARTGAGVAREGKKLRQRARPRAVPGQPAARGVSDASRRSEQGAAHAPSLFQAARQDPRRGPDALLRHLPAAGRPGQDLRYRNDQAHHARGHVGTRERLGQHAA